MSDPIQNAVTFVLVVILVILGAIAACLLGLHAQRSPLKPKTPTPVPIISLPTKIKGREIVQIHTYGGIRGFKGETLTPHSPSYATRQATR